MQCKNGHDLTGENSYRHPDGYVRCLSCRRKYQKRWSDGHTFGNYRSHRTWVENHRKERRAHNLLRKSILRGDVCKPDKCSKCGECGRIQGHHENYNKPLQVVWLCSKCHKESHRKVT